MPKVSIFFKNETDICELDDINFYEYQIVDRKVIEKNIISLSNRFFAYQDKMNRIKLVFDLFKEDKNKCNYNEVCCVHCQHEKIKFISDWDHIYIEDINDYLEEIKDEEKFNLTFSDLLQFKMTFLSKYNNKTKIIHIVLPCIRYMYKANQNNIDKAISPSIQIMDDFDVDFYRLNLMMKELKKECKEDNKNQNCCDVFVENKNKTKSKELDLFKYDKYNKILIISNHMIIIWDLNNNVYKSIDLNSKNEMKHLELVIIEAEWHYNGEYFIVTCKSRNSMINNFYLSIIFDIDLNIIALIEEPRSQKVLILESDELNSTRYFHIFTFGKKLTNSDFKYGMYVVEKRKNEVILKILF